MTNKRQTRSRATSVGPVRRGKVKMKELSMVQVFGRTDNKGQVMVETAIVLMFLLVLVFGIIEFGRALYTKNMLNNAARAGARAAVVMSPLNNLPRTYTNASTVDNIQQNIFGSIFYVDKSPSLLSATVCVADNTGACTAKPAAASGDPVNVIVTYTGFQSVVPGLVPLSPNLTGIATMRYE